MQCAYIKRIASPWCRWCTRGEPVRMFGFTPPDMPKEHFELARCPECGTWQVTPHPTIDEIRSYFADPKRWGPSPTPDGDIVAPFERVNARRPEYEQYAQAAIKHLPANGGRILDVGAGAGLMLSLLPGHFEKTAVEPNPVVAEKLRGQGLSVIEAWAEDLALPKNSQVLIMFNQSLDHLDQSGLFLETCQKWIKPGGLCLITSLIDPESLMARIYKHHFRLWHPFHQIYPTPRATAMLLEMWGFEIIKWWKPYFKTPYGGFDRLIKTMPKVLGNVWRPHEPSPAWPGNTYSLLARKKAVLLETGVPARAGV